MDVKIFIMLSNKDDLFVKCLDGFGCGKTKYECKKV